VPQHISEIRDTDIYFRVSEVYRDKRIVVKCGDETITSRRAVSLAPAEMEKVKISADKLRCLSSSEISVSVE
jgi:hypothetical protein